MNVLMFMRLSVYSGIVIGIGVDFGGQPGHVPPNNWETTMYLSLFTTFCPQYFGLPTQYFWQVYATGYW